MSDFKLGMGIVIKAHKDWRGIGQLQVVSPTYNLPTLDSVLRETCTGAHSMEAICGDSYAAVCSGDDDNAAVWNSSSLSRVTQPVMT